MKRLFALLLALTLVLSLAPTAFADVLWVPDDPFLQEHMDDCEHLERSFYAAGPNGTVTAYASPESAAVAKKLENGELVTIVWTYTDDNGICWGLCEYFGDEGWDGWIPMDYLHLKYDSQSFREEFEERIISGEATLNAEGTVRFWSYPGSEDFFEFTLERDYRPVCFQTFTDDAGRVWGHINYHMGIRDVWVCLDDPTADYDTLYAAHTPQQVTPPEQPDPSTLDEIKPGGISMEIVLIAAAAVAGFSGGFLWFTRKKKPKEIRHL